MAVGFAVEQDCGALGMQSIASETIKLSGTGRPNCRLGKWQQRDNQCTVRNAQPTLNYRLEIRTAGREVRRADSSEQSDIPGVVKSSLGVGRQAGRHGSRVTREIRMSQANVYPRRTVPVSRQSPACDNAPVRNSPVAARQMYARNVVQGRCSQRSHPKCLTRCERMAKDIRQAM